MSNDSGCLGTSRKRRRISLTEEGDHANADAPGTAEGSIGSSDLISSYVPPAAGSSHTHPEANISTTSTNAKLGEQTVTPFLAQHVPAQQTLSGASDETHDVVPSQTESSKKNYCYRHRPGVKCRRQADEPSMDQLQRV